MSFARLVLFVVLLTVAALTGFAQAPDPIVAAVEAEDWRTARAEIAKIRAANTPLFRDKNYEYLLGRIAERTGDTAAAVANYQAITSNNSKLKEYANGLFIQDIDALVKQNNLGAVKGFAERVLPVSPKFGALYLYYGVSLKNENKTKEAMTAFAKCHLLPNQFQQRAKQQLDIAYRTLNKGSMVGLDKFIKGVEAELK